MKIRKAKLSDFNQLYNIGRSTPELRVSQRGRFMEKDEFKWYITNAHGVLLVAEKNDKIAGFICADAKDAERQFKKRRACIIYYIVLPKYRRK
jgi:ribosomal protein S18 acetylase RimI-like enzyme